MCRAARVARTPNLLTTVAARRAPRAALSLQLLRLQWLQTLPLLRHWNCLHRKSVRTFVRSVRIFVRLRGRLSVWRQRRRDAGLAAAAAAAEEVVVEVVVVEEMAAEEVVAEEAAAEEVATEAVTSEAATT